MPKQVRDENGLTAQQAHFVKLLAKGYSQVDRQLLKHAGISDLDSVGEAFDHLMKLIEKAERSENFTAVAALMRQRLTAHGMLQQKVMVSAENSMSDQQLIEHLAGGDPEKEALLWSMLGAPSSFDEPDDGIETRH